MVELTKNTQFNFFCDFDKIHFCSTLSNREAILKKKNLLLFPDIVQKAKGGGLSTICIGEIQCVPYAEFLGTCICVSVSPTFATKNKLILRPARLPKPKFKQICHIIMDFTMSFA